MIKWFADLSYWNMVYTKQALQLLKDHGMAAVVLRASEGYNEDGYLEQHIGNLEQLDIPYGYYCFLYPWLDHKKQIDKFLEVCEKHPNKNVKVLDAEYYQDGSGNVMSQDVLNKFYDDSVYYIVNNLTSPVIYTAAWCVDKYFPGLLVENDDWYAHYVKYCAWFQNMLASMGASIDEKTGKLTTIDYMQTILEECQKRTPKLPQGITDWGGWQFNTYWPFKELTYGQRHIDVNLLKPELWEEWFGIVESEPEPEPEPEETQEQMMRARYDPKRATVKPV